MVLLVMVASANACGDEDAKPAKTVAKDVGVRGHDVMTDASALVADTSTAAPADSVAGTPDVTIDVVDTALSDASAVTPVQADAGAADVGHVDVSQSDAVLADGAAMGDGDAGLTADSGASGDVGAGVGFVKTIAVPACAANCLLCHLCGHKPVCVGGVTYSSECHAICALKAPKWPGGFQVAQGPCQYGSCDQCTKSDVPKLHCASLADGTKVTVAKACDATCLKLNAAASPNPSAGPCTSKCTDQIGFGGGGCPHLSNVPVCSATDGKSYKSVCAMEHCNLPGCQPLGSTVGSAKCNAGAMKVQCPGACHDKAKWPACPDSCAPVCAIDKAGQGMTYRNGCIAKANGADPAGCDGVSATPAGKCSGALYASLGVGCCPGLNYAKIKPICASIPTATGPDFYTFRSLQEFGCLTKLSKQAWKFEFQGPCLCACNMIKKPVCGADGMTYQNSCHAKCYNGANFQMTDGPCGG